LLLKVLRIPPVLNFPSDAFEDFGQLIFSAGSPTAKMSPPGAVVLAKFALSLQGSISVIKFDNLRDPVAFNGFNFDVDA
jgi:hypothetical protein